MGCLIWFSLTVKASEDAGKFFMLKYIQFFRGCKVVGEVMDGKRMTYTIYVRWAENKTSDFLVNYFQHDRNIEKVKIIS